MQRSKDYTDVLHIKDVDRVDREVRAIVSMMSPGFDLEPYRRVFHDVLLLFNGRFPGYKACNTDYHDLDHTVSTLLATARLVHGVSVERTPLPTRLINLALIAALLHDSGYIQQIGEIEGTGAKHTLTHVFRSVVFTARYFRDNGFREEDARDCGVMIQCTDPALDLSKIRFASPEVETLGHIVATADIVGQMADDIYLEKLSMLYKEFREGGVRGFESEFDLMKKSMGFYEFITYRLRLDMGNVFRCLRSHFQARHDIDKNLYDDYIRKNMSYLARIVEEHGEDYPRMLRRSRSRSRKPFRIASAPPSGALAGRIPA